MTTEELVARTCAASGVPVVPEDPAALARVASLLAPPPRARRAVVCRQDPLDGPQLKAAA